jgi:hypothetical protein
MVLFGWNGTIKKKIALNRLEEPTGKIGKVLGRFLPKRRISRHHEEERSWWMSTKDPILPLSPTTFGPNDP